ncbi:MAG: hypothetical protein AAGA15_00625 [Pseudomonadota bacterium]
MMITVTLAEAVLFTCLLVAFSAAASLAAARYLRRPARGNAGSTQPDAAEPTGTSDDLGAKLEQLDAKLTEVHDHVEWLATERMVDVAAEVARNAAPTVSPSVLPTVLPGDLSSSNAVSNAPRSGNPTCSGQAPCLGSMPAYGEAPYAGRSAPLGATHLPNSGLPSPARHN